MKFYSKPNSKEESVFASGTKNSTNSDLLSIIIGGRDKHKKAKQLISMFTSLTELKNASVNDLTKIVTFNQAMKIKSMFCLSGRERVESTVKGNKVGSSQDAFEIFNHLMTGLDHEECWVILMRRNNSIIKTIKISSGGYAGTVIDAKVLFNAALSNKASSLILGHNHPSGNNKPSRADDAITEKLKKAGKTLDILLLDHIICPSKSGNYYSYADEGKMQ